MGALVQSIDYVIVLIVQWSLAFLFSCHAMKFIRDDYLFENMKTPKL